jgi:hypothetical protein
MLPSAFKASSIELIKSESVQRSVSRGGNIQVGRRTSSEIALEITSPEMSPDEIGNLIAFLDDVGLNTPFDVQLPLLSKAKGSITSNMLVKGSVSAGGKVITLDGGPNNSNGIVKPNDMVTFSGHSKAYFVGVNMSGNSIDSFDTNGSGELVLRLSQPLRKSIAANETANFITPLITVLRTSDETEIKISASNSNFSTISFQAVEFI